MSHREEVTLTTDKGKSFTAVLDRDVFKGYRGWFNHDYADIEVALDLMPSQLAYLDDMDADTRSKYVTVRAALAERRDEFEAVMAARSAADKDDSLERAAQERQVRVEQDTRTRLEAAERFKSERADKLAAESDSGFDAWDDLAPYWDAPPLMPDVGAMTNGVCLFYSGYRNGLFGPSECGKTIMAAHLVVQEISAGRPAVYLDYENGGHAFTGLLRAFGATREMVSLVRYKWMDGGPVPSAGTAAKLAAALVADGGRLAVLDTVSPAMAALGLDQFSNPDVERFYALAMDAWADAGCAPVVLDHTPNADPFKAYGAERKRSGIYGMLLNLIPKVPFSRYEAGYSNLYINKDRHGALSYVLEDGRRLAAQLHVVPDLAELAAGSADGKGTVEIRPMDGDALARTRAEAAAREEEDRLAAEGAKRMEIRRWVQNHDLGDGVVESHIYKTKTQTGVEPVPGKLAQIRDLVKKMLDDPDDPMVKTDGKVRVLPPEVEE